MKKVIMVLAIMMFLCASCVATTTHLNVPQPDRDIWMLLVTPHGAAVYKFEKGEFDKTDQERGYPIFNSEEEAEKFFDELMNVPTETREL